MSNGAVTGDSALSIGTDQGHSASTVDRALVSRAASIPAREDET